jgi:hypothetical protein
MRLLIAILLAFLSFYVYELEQWRMEHTEEAVRYEDTIMRLKERINKLERVQKSQEFEIDSFHDQFYRLEKRYKDAL